MLWKKIIKFGECKFSGKLLTIQNSSYNVDAIRPFKPFKVIPNSLAT